MGVNYLELYRLSLNNAKDLNRESEILFDNQCYSRSYFLAFSGLEEVSKAIYSADVVTGLKSEELFKKFYTNHKKKSSRMKWAHLDSNNPYYDFIRNTLGQGTSKQINISEPNFKKRQESLYVDVDWDSFDIYSPENEITKEDALGIRNILENALYQIWDTTENWGHTIGTKGFMK